MVPVNEEFILEGRHIPHIRDGRGAGVKSGARCNGWEVGAGRGGGDWHSTTTFSVGLCLLVITFDGAIVVAAVNGRGQYLP